MSPKSTLFYLILWLGCLWGHQVGFITVVKAEPTDISEETGVSAPDSGELYREFNFVNPRQSDLDIDTIQQSQAVEAEYYDAKKNQFEAPQDKGSESESDVPNTGEGPLNWN